MLVLRRKVGDKIVIGDSIEVTVLHVRGNKVRLGFTAPKAVRVYRHEAARTQPPGPAEAAEQLVAVAAE